MKLISLLLPGLLSFINISFAALPSFEAFRGSNNIVIVSNVGANKILIDGGKLQPGSANLTNWSNIPTGSMANVVATDYLTNWANAISNLTQTKQFGSANLTNWSSFDTNVISLGTVPIGAIVAWDKSLTGVPALPANFVECNGQTISDAASPLNGRTIRNLNGNNSFLRGNSTSGGSGGTTSHTHTYSGITDVEDGDIDVQSNSGSPVTVASFAHLHGYAGVTDGGSSIPPYVDMVWVMRIK